MYVKSSGHPAVSVYNADDSFSQCFSTLYSEEEPFAAILTAHGTNGHGQKFVLGEMMKFETEAGNDFLEREQQST